MGRNQAYPSPEPPPFSRPRPNWARGLSLCTFALIFTALLAAVASADPDTRGGFGAGPANGQIVRSSPVGSIPGELAVGANGAASWSTPLEFLGEVGDTGMGLSVGQGDGEAKITGPGLISRCLDTTAFEGIPAGIAFDDQDRLCYGAQRLVLAAGSWGKDGAIYAPRVDDGTRIEQVGALSDSKSHFEAHPARARSRSSAARGPHASSLMRPKKS